MLELLNDDDIGEDDKPDALRDLLEKYLPEDGNLDTTVLAVLHRHREDVAPTGQSFALPSASPATGSGPHLTPSKSSTSLSRSSSFRRHAFPAGVPAHVLPGGSPVVARPHSPSPLRPVSPSPSMRMLNVGASEFKPNGGSSANASPMLAQEAQLRAASPAPIWGGPEVGASPLGTPRFAPSSTSVGVNSAYGSPANGSYFPQMGAPTAPIPRGPWSEGGTDGGATGPASSGADMSASDTSSSDDPSDGWPGSSSAEKPPTMGAIAPDADYDPFNHGEVVSALEDYDPFGSPSVGRAGDGASFSSLPPEPPPEDIVPPPVVPGGLSGDSNAYSMTPLDMLVSVFADSGVSHAEIEDALQRNGWDVDRTIEHLVRSNEARPAPSPAVPPASMMPPGPLTPGGSFIGRPTAIAMPPPGFAMPPRGSGQSSPRYGIPVAGRPMGSPGLNGPSSPGIYPPSAVTNRVCRYYVRRALCRVG